MDWRILISNPLINAGVLSWILAQVIKLIYYFSRNRQVRLERLTGGCGMPSAHSAVSCSVTMFRPFEQWFFVSYFCSGFYPHSDCDL